MRYIRYLLIILFFVVIANVVFVSSIIGSDMIVRAQEQCDIDTVEVVEVVEAVCTGIGDNQVCYGNFDVGADVVDELLDEDFLFNFNNPGDIADLVNIQSLYLSALNPEEETWGIAQMRLITSTFTGSQELNLLLFGDVEIENAVEPTVVVEVQVGIYSANIRNLPSVSAVVLQSVSAGTLLEAVGRLEDNSWVRVRTETGAVGWISVQLIQPVDEDETINNLAVQDTSSPYFGPMQAFYFEQGSGSDCGNVTSDGLLIQTPQGSARVTVSINGVNIDLIPGQTGATALVQGNDFGMTISMIEGESLIETGGTGYYLEPRDKTSIPIGDDSLASAAPTFPTIYDIDTVVNLPTLSLVSTVDPLAPSNISINTSATTEGAATGNDTATNNDTIGGGTTSTNAVCNANPNANENACTNNAGGNGNGGNGNGKGNGKGNNG
jgi:SH3 domain-containing protein